MQGKLADWPVQRPSDWLKRVNRAENEKELAAQVPMNRFGTPEEVGEAVAFFASKASSYITGEVLSINGGLYT